MGQYLSANIEIIVYHRVQTSENAPVLAYRQKKFALHEMTYQVLYLHLISHVS